MLSRATAAEVLARCAGRRILVVGDLMLDRYIAGTVSRISPEAPVPVVRVKDEHALPGGAANVALNVQALGAQAIVTGMVGRDAAGAELCRLMTEQGICTDGVVADEDLVTTVKTRIVAERQQVVRVDREQESGPSTRVVEQLCERVQSLKGDVAGIIIEDYGKGVVSQAVVDGILTGLDASTTPVALDPKDNHDIAWHGLALATPNYREACAAAGVHESASRVSAGKDDPVLAEVGRVLRERWAPALLMITLGQDGMYLLPIDGMPVTLPARAREVFDVSGAGDTVVSVALLALASGADAMTAAALANGAAGVVVGKLGAATCRPDELLEDLA